MRIAAMAMAVIAGAGLGCKDRQPAKPPTEAAQPAEPTRVKPRPALETADVKGGGVVPVTELAATIVYAKDAIKVNGETLVAIANDGLVNPERLQSVVRVLEKVVRSDHPVGLQIDATIPYFQFGIVLGALRRAGFSHLALLVGPDKMLPFQLPSVAEGAAGALRPVITVKDGRIVLWSYSGEEGTFRQPKADLLVADASLAPLTNALAEIVQRRWPDGKRPPGERSILIQLERRETAGTLMRVLAASRVHGTLELFPDAVLSAGI